jgi:hypothetical protein
MATQTTFPSSLSLLEPDVAGHVAWCARVAATAFTIFSQCSSASEAREALKPLYTDSVDRLVAMKSLANLGLLRDTMRNQLGPILGTFPPHGPSVDRWNIFLGPIEDLTEALAAVVAFPSPVFPLSLLIRPPVYQNDPFSCWFAKLTLTDVTHTGAVLTGLRSRDPYLQVITPAAEALFLRAQYNQARPDYDVVHYLTDALALIQQ